MINVVGRDNYLLKRVTCRNCISILEYAQVAVKKGISMDYTGCKDSYNYVLCPCCGKEVQV